MIKRYGLAVLLFCFSISTGIAIALLETAAAFFFSFGLPVLIGTVTILFAAAIVSWVILKGKGQIRDPERWVRHQGTAFAAWFAAHNLAWALAASISTWGLLTLFGFKPWVIIFSAGALACTSFALTGTFLIRKGEMLGLCWQSAIPDGLGNFWARAGATMILRERYEYVAEQDQNRPTPTLWSISRIFNRSETGGADRSIDLLETRRDFLSTQSKKEWRHRFKVLLVLFWVTAALAALPGILGFVSPHWDRVPGGWPADKMKSSPPEKPPMMASKPSKPEPAKENENRNKDQDPDAPTQQEDSGKETHQDQGNQSTPGGDSSEASQGGQQINAPGQSSSNRDQNSKENGNGKENSETSAGDSSREQKGKGDSKQGDANKNRQGKGEPGQDQKNQGSGESPGRGKETDREAGNNSEQEGSNQGQQGKDKGESGKGQDQAQPQGSQGSQGLEGSEAAEPGQDGSGQSRDGQKNQGKGQEGSAGTGKDKSEGVKGSERGDNTKPGQTGGAGKGRGEGQGLGAPDATPEMRSEPEPLPQIPSRATNMVTLELPTLQETGSPGKGNGDSPPKPPLDQLTPGHRPAPTSPSQAGKQERPASKPEQYLPNWILNLLGRK